MSSIDLVASTVLDQTNALLNCQPNTFPYTYTVTIKYLRMALQELQEHYELNNLSVTDQASAIINIPKGATTVSFNAIGSPALPNDLIEPLQLWERQEGVNPFVPMNRRGFLPHNLEGYPVNQLIYWAWQHNQILFLEANQDNDIKIDYIRSLFPNVMDQNSPINVINAITFLQYRTAALCAEFIERNLTSSNALNAYAVLGSDRATGIATKGKQNIFSRRKPFRAGYKKRGLPV